MDLTILECLKKILINDQSEYIMNVYFELYFYDKELAVNF